MSADNKVNVTVPDEQRTGVYSNAVSVSVTNNDLVVDFGYITPGSNPTQVVVVSRVNLSHGTGQSFMKVLQDAILDHQNKMKEAAKKKK